MLQQTHPVLEQLTVIEALTRELPDPGNPNSAKSKILQERVNQFNQLVGSTGREMARSVDGITEARNADDLKWCGNASEFALPQEKNASPYVAMLLANTYAAFEE